MSFCLTKIVMTNLDSILKSWPNQSILRKSVLNMHWKDWCWSWNSNILATWCEELTYLKRPWCCERLRAGGEGDNRGWDGWMASPAQWAWVWVDSRSWWWTGRPGVLWFMGSQRVGHDWATELNWTDEGRLCSWKPWVQIQTLLLIGYMNLGRWSLIFLSFIGAG